MFDPTRDADLGNRVFYRRLGLILTAGCLAIGLMLIGKGF
jgi:hypothetical protein